MAKQMKYGRYLHGGDYNPEQWLDRPDILQKDIEYFKKAHINTVSVGIFSWAVLEPEEGKYNFDWLEEIINNLYKEGIYTILATPSGARPKWMADKYEEVLRMDPDRTRRFFGGRHNHCFTSPVYREKVHAIDKKLAERFGKHPAVMLWHISNEFGGECHCPLCQAKFREWLKEKYGTIENLNKSWCTTFWSHIYNSFDQIESPSTKGENELHALKLDWKRFVTDQTIDFIKNEVDAIREGGSELPVTANLMYDLTVWITKNSKMFLILYPGTTIRDGTKKRNMSQLLTRQCSTTDAQHQESAVPSYGILPVCNELETDQ